MKFFLFDRPVHDGSFGGPLISIYDQMVVGVVSERFDPLETSSAVQSDERMTTSFSYAVSIEFAFQLMEEEMLESF